MKKSFLISLAILIATCLTLNLHAQNQFTKPKNPSEKMALRAINIFSSLEPYTRELIGYQARFAETERVENFYFTSMGRDESTTYSVQVEQSEAESMPALSIFLPTGDTSLASVIFTNVMGQQFRCLFIRYSKSGKWQLVHNVNAINGLDKAKGAVAQLDKILNEYKAKKKAEAKLRLEVAKYSEKLFPALIAKYLEQNEGMYKNEDFRILLMSDGTLGQLACGHNQTSLIFNLVEGKWKMDDDRLSSYVFSGSLTTLKDIRAKYLKK